MTWRLGHRPALDGLRGIAVLLVVAAHFDQNWITIAGPIGVMVFFTLSGFLITSLLLQERVRSGRTDLREFYRRRALRLFPALAAMLLVVALFTMAGAPTGARTGMFASVAGYVSNWYLLATPVDGHIVWGALGHTWSLAIEEQFYVVWPLLFMVAIRYGRKAILAISVGLAATSATVTLLADRPLQATDSAAYCLLVGCALAAWMSGRQEGPGSRAVPVAAVGALIGLVVVDSDHLAYIAVPLLTSAAIWSVTQAASVGWLSARPLEWVGQRSYGLYLWHVPVAVLWGRLDAPYLVVVVTGVALSFGLTVLSWRYVEQPFLRMKDRRSVVDGVGPGRREGVHGRVVVGSDLVR
ncbi:MAG TPA: acyltransferase [Aeromicrobium sp.]|nr:acyltransferase [Aeromicrobium sp.]HKY57653.1 acyltransferase [Aeromicrobium sp.]